MGSDPRVEQKPGNHGKTPFDGCWYKFSPRRPLSADAQKHRPDPGPCQPDAGPPTDQRECCHWLAFGNNQLSLPTRPFVWHAILELWEIVVLAGRNSRQIGRDGGGKVSTTVVLAGHEKVPAPAAEMRMPNFHDCDSLVEIAFSGLDAPVFPEAQSPAAPRLRQKHCECFPSRICNRLETPLEGSA